MAAYRYVVADVFTDTPLTGNQLAVFTDGRGLDDATMQALALEIGFSETTFVLPPEQGGTAGRRPLVEIRRGRHPTPLDAVDTDQSARPPIIVDAMARGSRFPGTLLIVATLVAAGSACAPDRAAPPFPVAGPVGSVGI